MAEETQKLSLFEKAAQFFRGVKTEYDKIIFPNWETVRKQTIVVVVVSILISLLIFVLDFIMKFLLGFIL